MQEHVASPEFEIWGHAGFCKDLIVNRLRTLGLRMPEAFLLQRTLLRWIRCEGPKGYLLNVERQKQAWINLLIDKPNLLVPGCSRFSNGIPVHTRMLSLLSVKRRFQVLKFLKNLIKFKRLQYHQWLKFRNSAIRPISPPEWVVHYASVVCAGSKLYRHNDILSYRSVPPLSEITGNSGKKTFSPFDTRVSAPREPMKVLQDGLKAAASNAWLKKVIPIFEPNYDQLDLPKTVGLIGCTQEPGGKARFFASVHPVYQFALTPLSKALKFRSKRDPASYAFKQETGRRKVQSALQKGTVWSFDLSDATNNFPIGLQLPWMWETMNPEQVWWFQLVSTAPFKCNQEIFDRFGQDTLTFTNGQPLGLLPSAHAFHLTHIYLLRGLEIELYGRPRNRFAVLVDDVSIFDERLADAYRLAMERLEVPLSLQKSLSSNKAAEFLGRLITPTQVIELTKQEPVTLANVIEYARVMGPEVLGEINSSRYRRYLLPLLKLPVSLGGAGCGGDEKLVDSLSHPIAREWINHLLTKSKKTEGLGDTTTRIRDILRASRLTGIRLNQDTLDYLSRLLPRRRSRIPTVHYCHPDLGTIWKGSKASSLTIAVEGRIPSVILREDPAYDSLNRLSRSSLSYRDVVRQAQLEHTSFLIEFLNDKIESSLSS